MANDDKREKTEETEIKELKLLRGIIKGQVTKLKTYLSTKGKDANAFELETKLGILESYLINFNAHQAKLECLDKEEANADERATFEDSYFELKSKLLKLIDTKKTRSSISFETTHIEGSVYPKTTYIKNLELPKFSGEITEWLEFWSSFQRMVDENDSLNDLAKFQHLKGCLVGNAKNIIKNIDNVDEGYKEAISLLKQRYFNKRFLFHSHINSILDVQAVSKATVENIRGIVDTINGNIRSLLTIGDKSQIADALLLQLVLPRLDRASQIRWEEYVAEKYSKQNQDDGKEFIFPNWNELSEFLERRCRTLETLEIARLVSSDKTKFKRSSFVTSTPENCLICQEPNHSLFSCKKFKQMTPISRYDEAKKLRLCILCLKPGHTVKSCSEKECTYCSGNHHNLLHRSGGNHNHNSSKNFNNKPKFGNQTHSNSNSNQLPTSTTTQTSNFTHNAVIHSNSNNDSICLIENERVNALIHSSESRQVILPTALINVKNVDGNFVQCRALLDSASQSNFITKKLADKLNLKTVNTNIAIAGIGNVNSSTSKYKSEIYLTSRINRFSETIDVFIIDKITGLQPNRRFDLELIKFPENITLADPKFNIPAEIDVLIGADLFWKILCVGQIRCDENSPFFQKTVFGWVASGSIITNSTFSFCCLTSENNSENLENVMRKFWEIENLSDEVPKPSVEHSSCEQHFKMNFERDDSGRCIVKLPLNEDPSVLGDTYNIALKRFMNLERKLKMYPQLRLEYTKFLTEYLELDHMELVSSHHINLKGKFFLPHHCVIKLDSSSTKYRVVFDGSSKGTKNKSLNDILLNGPTVQDDLFSILLRFRMYLFVLAGDIAKMYRQVLLHEDDRDLQCILWRDRPEDSIKIFRLKTVTYGTKSASFLAIRSLNEIAHIYSKSYPLGSKAILKDFYVDNLLTGCNSLKQLKQIKNEIVKILDFGKFPIKKWSSNSNIILQDIPQEDKEPMLKFNNDDIIKTLGLNWNPISDELMFYYKDSDNTKLINKRTILSQIAKFFDPLGLINPIITAAKIFQQHLWKIKLEWDESLPLDLHTKWKDFQEQLKLVNHIRINRNISSISSQNELHCFCDASEKAYGACIYLRNIQNNNQIRLQLMCAKSKVSPLKKISLARLELCAALLLSQLVHKLKLAIAIKFSNIYCWSDSTIALAWINSQSYELSTFVANRITKIHEKTSNCIWRHCPTKLNPADLISRGATPKGLIESKFWYNGPEFLYLETSRWPILPEFPKDIPERRTLKFSFTSVKIYDEIGSHKYVNNYLRLLRIFAYVSRFIYNSKCKNKNNRKYQHLTSSEIRKGEILIINNLQMIYFSSTYEKLKNKAFLKADSNIRCLNPFLDEQNIIRVGGRIKYADLPFSAKHQILLPSSHPFVNALINYFHTIYCHTGCQNLLNILRERYWILHGKAVVRKVIHRCLTCFRLSAKPSYQIMADLPKDRVSVQRPFLISGVDYCGPFFTTHRIRGRPAVKCYIAIFVCFSTKAVHMELVADLTTNSFIAALKRFFARRGKCCKIYSDNATNFTGAYRHFQEFATLQKSKSHLESIQQFSLQNGFEWRFIPPRSPHWGGLWESAVKVAKVHLYKICNKELFTYEEFYTLICQVEMVMNSRPISPVSNDPNDFSSLSPGHFLIGEPMVCINYPPMNDASTLSDRYKKIHSIYQKFWSQWSKSYLNNLQTRQKWIDQQKNIKIGDLVLLAEDNTPSMKWPLGRVAHIQPGKDNKVRLVTISTSSGNYIRSINKICRLPIESSSFQGGEYEETLDTPS